MEDTSSDKYIERLENEKGGKITYRCLSLFYADTNNIIRDHGVFLYQINGTMFYEDFMFKRSFLGIELNKKENEEYVKFESSFDINEIVKMKVVKKNDALRYCRGEIVNISEAGFLLKLFGSTALMLEFNDRSSVFLDLPVKDFIRHIEETQKETK